MQSDHKKILSSLITTLLIISILTLPTPYAEAAKYTDLIDEISPTSGPIGVTVTVSGKAPKDISEDYPVKIYWCTSDQVPDVAGEGYGYGAKGKLLDTVEEPTEDTTDEYEVDVTVPDVPPPSGTTYYIVAWQDDGDDYVESGEWDSEAFTVVKGLETTEGNVGDEVVVGGWDTTNPGGLVIIYWDTQASENKLAEVYSKAGYGGAFTVTISVPETVCGTYSIIVVDDTIGTIDTYTFELKPEITLSPDTALEGDTITVDGTGFAAESAVTLSLDGEELTTSPSDVETDENGSFTCTFEVPDGTTTGDHTVKAIDEDDNSAEATLTIGPSITISPTSGPSGTIVTITGRGFTGTGIEGGEYINITIDDTECPLIEDIKVRSDGRFSGKFVIPTVEEADTYTITAWVHEHKDVSSTADFEVTGISDISVTPTSGSPGSTVTIEGINFTAKAGIEITIDFGDLEEYATTETNATGGFLTAISVPSVPVTSEAYTITATDEYGLTASADFRVALTTLAISPSSGSTGEKILLMGGGLTPETSFNVTIDGELMIYTESAQFTTDDDGNIKSGTYVYVPTVPVGTHTITVMDEEGIIATATYEVTATTEIVLTPSSAPKGYNVTFELNNFYHEENTAIDLTIYNVTADGEVDWETDLDLAVGTGNFTDKDVETNSTGCFKGWFRIPASFALGDYYINATDAEGLTAEVSFSVVEPTVIIYTGATEYMRGDTVAFFAKSSFSYEDETINLYTPENFVIEVPIAITTKVGELYTGSATYLLPADANLGVWFWNATVSGVTVNGTFTVAEKPTTVTLEEKVSQLSKDVDSLADTVKSLSGTVTAQASDIDKLSKAVSDLKSSVSELSAALSSLKGDVSNVASAVSNAQSAAEDASTAASAAQSAAAGISTAVYGAVILSLIAAVAAIMSIVILQRKIAG